MSMAEYSYVRYTPVGEHLRLIILRRLARGQSL
jgi:hypothetical protein